MIYIGTSGWQYDDWRGDFYPADLPKDQWLPYFSRHFPTVEVNNSFYRLPSREVFVRWRERSAPGTIIAVKGSRFVTHMKRLRDPKESIDMFWERARGLGDKLGPVLFQLPPRFPVEVERLATFLSLLPKQMQVAMEFRDPSWNIPAVRELLDARGAALVLPDSPGARVEPIVTGGWSYVRFHKGTAAGSDYPRAKLRRWADRVVDLPARDVYVYFNNDPGGAAIRDARTFAEMLAGRAPLAALAS